MRDCIPGSEIGTKKQFIAKGGQLVLSKIDARNGAFGILPDEYNSAIITGNFWAFDVDSKLLESQYFDYLTKTPLFIDFCIRASDGTTNRRYLQEPKFLTMKIPLPPLEQQRSLVARIEELAGKIEEARSLRRQAIKETEALIQAVRCSLIGEAPCNGWISLSKLVREIENGWSPACESRPVTGEEWGVLKVGAVSFGSYNQAENKALPTTLKPQPQYEVRPRDFLISRANTVELVSACTVVEKTRSRLMLNDKIFRFSFREDNLIEPRYLDYVLKSSALRTQIQQGASGTSPTMKNISKDKVLKLLIPSHTISEQRQIVAYLNELQAKLDAMKRLRENAIAELDALLPSILDKAFKGELL